MEQLAAHAAPKSVDRLQIKESAYDGRGLGMQLPHGGHIEIELPLMDGSDTPRLELDDENRAVRLLHHTVDRAPDDGTAAVQAPRRTAARIFSPCPPARPRRRRGCERSSTRLPPDSTSSPHRRERFAPRREANDDTALSRWATPRADRHARRGGGRGCRAGAPTPVLRQRHQLYPSLRHDRPSTAAAAQRRRAARRNHPVG